VLGYDIMIDSNLNPWLIEVNHLPSFGTDSVLDRDIKERLMEQVFSVLPALPDDQQAYMLHHKAESEKRLNAQKRTNALLEKREREAKEKELRERPRPPVRPREVKRDTVVKTEPAAEFGSKNESEKSNPESVRSGSSAPDAAEDDDIFDEECTPERIIEIKAILFDVYKKFSPEKLNKIDRLLAKYVSHEEEFLRFVFNKYSVSPALYKNGNFPDQAQMASVPENLSPIQTEVSAAEETSPVDTPAQEAEVEHEQELEQEGGNDTADESTDRQDENQAENNGSNTARESKTDANIPVNRNQREVKLDLALPG